MTIGAYGSGAKPIISLNPGITWLEPTGTTFGDFRAMDLDIRGGGVNDSAQRGFNANSAHNNLTFLRVDMSAMGAANITFAANCTGCIIQDSSLSNNHNAAIAYLTLVSSGLLGNTFGPAGTGGEHSLRIAKAQKSVIANNTVTTSRPQKEVFSLRAEAHSTNANDSFYNVVSGNKIVQGTLAGVLFQTTNGGETDVRIYDTVIEGNWFKGDSIPGSGYTCTYIRNIGTRITIRNNLFDMAECGDGASGVLVLRDGASDPSPSDVNIYNNTFYTPIAKQYVGVELQKNSTNTIVRNNLCRFPSGTGGTTCLKDGGTGTTATNNSTNPQTTGTDPSFDTPLSTPSGFRISTSSYAATGGTALYPASNSDFFNCDDTSVSKRMGAFISRTRARCRGGAGP